MSQEVAYDFEWDPLKAESNARKHGVTFDQAATVFLDALALTIFDVEHSQHEERWFTLGYDATGGLLAVAHTFQPASPERTVCASFRRGPPRHANGGSTKMSLDR